MVLCLFRAQKIGMGVTHCHRKVEEILGQEYIYRCVVREGGGGRASKECSI